MVSNLALEGKAACQRVGPSLTLDPPVSQTVPSGVAETSGTDLSERIKTEPCCLICVNVWELQ